MQTRSCKQCSTNFEITDKDLDFYEKISPVFDGKKISIPSPTFCPDCRQQRRLSFRNERSFYSRKSSLGGKQIVSTISPDKSYPTYDIDEWWGGSWDAIDYGIEYDFSKTFFEQFDSIFSKTPHLALAIMNSENCTYNNFCSGCKDCYQSIRVGESEKVFYSYLTSKSTNIFDSSYVMHSENCYSCIDIKNCFNCFYIQDCEDCNDCILCYDSIGSNKCFGSTGLRNKQYVYFNEQLSKEEYENIMTTINFGSNKVINDLKIKFYETKKTYTHKENSNRNSENILGNKILDSKEIFHGFDVIESENCRYVNGPVYTKKSMDGDYNYYCENSYEQMSTVHAVSTYFSCCSLNSSNVIYSYYNDNCSFCFGCVNFRNKSYCILNKQYSKEEYFKIVPQIIEKMTNDGEWGEFFPSSISPFGYNETIANEFFPLSKEKAIKEGFKWSEYESPLPKVEKIINADKLPEDIKDLPEDILYWAIKCEITKKPFKILQTELEFYRKHNIPIPKRHPDQRHLDRMKLRNPRKLFDRTCDKCEKDIKSSYSKNRKEIVYCEGCYDKEVY